MKACILLLALAVAVQAQKFEPVTCDWEKEMMCPGKWNEDWTEQMTADFCIPMKNGDCYNHCPMDCGKDMMCPGGMDPQGCAMPDSCHPGKFCPVNCDWEKEMMCAGKWNEDWTEQISGDYCIPMKSGDCYNHCPMDCGKDMMCPGGMDTQGCAMPDTCHPGKFCPVNCDWEKEMMCPGTWDAKTGEQTSADFCVPHKNGECTAHCPQTCQDGDMMCPGHTHADGCKDADYCIPGKFCPANCDWEKEMMCAGKWNEDWTEQISGDYCIPQKTGDCYNHCPMDCGKDMVCPGGMDANGCPMGDMCYPAGKDCPKM